MQVTKIKPVIQGVPPCAKENKPAEKKKKASKAKLTATALIICALAGLAILLSHPVGTLITNRQHEKAIEEYIAAVNSLSDEELTKIKEDAIEYNKEYALTHPYIWTEPYGQFMQEYSNELCVPGTDVIGYIEIPSIDVRLPIYHYATDENMRRGCGHSECASLPVGGTDGHYVILSHRNMMTSVTFEHLDKLKEGDTFSVTVLKDKVTFMVDNIRVVDPKCYDDYSDDKVEEGKELCTLVTCTPSGSTSYRLFVRGIRIE